MLTSITISCHFQAHAIINSSGIGTFTRCFSAFPTPWHSLQGTAIIFPDPWQCGHVTY